MKLTKAVLTMILVAMLTCQTSTADTNRYGLDLLPGMYCADDGGRIAISVENKREAASPSPDLTVEYDGKAYPAQTAYSYFGNDRAPPPHFVLGILPMEDGLAEDGILAFRSGEEHWLMYDDVKFKKC